MNQPDWMGHTKTLKQAGKDFQMCRQMEIENAINYMQKEAKIKR